MENKIKAIQKILVENGADACLITSSVNLFWICGFIFDGYLYITAERDPIYFVKRPIDLNVDGALYIRKPEQIPHLLSDLGIKSPKSVFIEANSISLNASKRLENALGSPKLLNMSGYLSRLRMIKNDYELNEMRESAKIHSKVYEEIPKLYRKGMTDLELQIEIEYSMRKHGSLGIFRSNGDNMDIFMGSVLAGDNAQHSSPYDFALGGQGISPILPLGANNSVLIPGQTVMIDMAGNFRPYMDDMSRTFVIEHAPDIAYKAHEVSLKIHNEIAKTAKDGTLCNELYNTAIEICEENNLSAYFMGTNQQAKFIGHGLGLEINEPPVISSRSIDKLIEGMTIALEPKFVLPNIGPVGIENTYIVKKNGLEKITIFEENLIALN
ncbi:MAG: M24 family metallopeptidase [Fermentimonas sp.]|jgi:Xaa-Pro aminopeptidase